MKRATLKPVKLTAKAKSLLKKAERTPMPRNLAPMLATLVNEPPKESGWQFEMKWDGYRTLAFLDGTSVELQSRNGKSFNEKFYPLTQSLEQWSLPAVLDGELVVLNEQGLPDFSGLQSWRSEADGALLYYLFDLLWLDGYSLMGLPLRDRQELLRALIPPDHPFLRASNVIEGNGKQAFEQARSLHLEGVMAKDPDSIYTPGLRSPEWLKVKTAHSQELVIGGYTINEGSSKPFSALLLGLYEDGKLQYVTPVGTGFSRKQQLDLLATFKSIETKTCPFATVPEYNKPSRFRPDPPPATVVWLKPKFVAEVEHRGRTSNGALRQPSFKGLRPDKAPKELRWEKAAETKGLEKHALVQNKVLAAPAKRGRKTLLNPSEETQTRTIGGNELRFTNLSKVYWPKEGYTKRDLINYYYQMAPLMLPYLKERPQILNRHPNGIDGPSFYQKDVKGKAPAFIETFPYYSYMDRRDKEFLVVTDEASLLYIASLGCIEINPWHSRRDRPDRPDWCIIDLDPDGNPFRQVIQTALVTRTLLDSIGVASYPKTSGSTGLHIYIPLGGRYNYEQSKEFGRKLARVIQADLPNFTSIERQTADRKGKLYIDFLMNRPQASVAAPYSLRPKPGATVSMPLLWDEVRTGLKMSQFTIRNAADRVRETGDLFKGVLGKGISLEKAEAALAALRPRK
ncbi:DNA ligase-like domain-containing protein [Flaviaesturariibacter terrae]